MSDPLSLSCPTCGGTGRIEPFRPTGFTSDPCPDCIEGYPKDRIERAAKGLQGRYEGRHPGHEWDDLGPDAQAWWLDEALAAIRAFHTESNTSEETNFLGGVV